jgi:RNA polymerase sigma-70 factor (ECF subfamily)
MLGRMTDVQTTSDGALAQSVGEGARDAEAELVRRFHRRVLLYGMRHLGDKARAEDLAQDVLVRVIERLRDGEVREHDRIGSFILGTARLMARSESRKGRRADSLAERVAAETETCTRAREPVQIGLLSECLMKLSERERAVVLLTFVSGEQAPAIAEAVGTTAGNVRVIRHRALAKLAELMGMDGGAS